MSLGLDAEYRHNSNFTILKIVVDVGTEGFNLDMVILVYVKI
jgi:hypothetical protein